jgi:hypothetical protein
MTTAELRGALKRHVGHTLRCERSECLMDREGFVLETLALRCDDCGEVVIETVNRLEKRRTHART